MCYIYIPGCRYCIYVLWGAKLLAVPPGGVVQVAGVQSAAADSGSWMRKGQAKQSGIFFKKIYSS